MLNIGNKEVKEIYLGNKKVSEVYLWEKKIRPVWGYTVTNSTIFHWVGWTRAYWHNWKKNFKDVLQVTFNINWWLARFETSTSCILPLDPITFKENKGTINLWYRYDRAAQTWWWATLFWRNYGSYHHLLIQDWSEEIGFYNADSINFWNSWFRLSLWRWYNICITYENGNAKMYINWTFISENSWMFNLTQEPIRSIGNYWYSEGYQWAIWLWGEVIIEDWIWTDEQVENRYNQTKQQFWL